jgi:hypothetical protein
MEIKTKFDIYEKVNISQLDMLGTVIEIQLQGLNLYYRIEYWANCEIKSVFLREEELKKIKP